MEKEQLIEMLKIYKKNLADAIEEKIAYQVLAAEQARQLRELEKQIQNLNDQLVERG